MQDEVKYGEIDWDEYFLEVTLVNHEVAGQTNLQVAETSWRDRHGSQTGTIEKIDGAITKEGEHSSTHPIAKAIVAEQQRVLQSHLRKHRDKHSYDIKEEWRLQTTVRQEQVFIHTSVKYFRSGLWCNQCKLQGPILTRGKTLRRKEYGKQTYRSSIETQLKYQLCSNWKEDMIVLQNEKKAEGAQVEIRAGTAYRVEVYSREKAQNEDGEKFSSILGARNHKRIDVESWEESRENDIKGKNRMKELIEHAVFRYNATLKSPQYEKNRTMEKEESTGKVTKVECLNFKGGY